MMTRQLQQHSLSIFSLMRLFEKYGFAAYVTDENADDAQADDAAEETEEAAEDTAE